MNLKSVSRYVFNFVFLSTFSVFAAPTIEEDHRLSFAQKILELTQAEEDLRLEAYYSLSHQLSSSLQKDKTLEGQWNALWGALKEPESIIYKDPYLRFCNSSVLTPFPEEEVFLRFGSIEGNVRLTVSRANC